jgi:segregation and condensation protein A
MFSVKLEQFEGPLHLLLELIESEKLDISQLSLANVTDAYVRHLQEHPDIPPEELADFLVVASKLLFIKSKLLLPFLYPAAEEEAGDLEGQLKIYKEYLDASKIIEKMIGKRRFLFVHEKLPKIEIGFAPPEGFGADRMAEMFRAVIARIEPVVKVPKAIIEKAVSINEKIKHLQSMLAKAEKLSFKSILMSAESRTEIIVSFLALLELVKQRSVGVDQGKLFDDITITRVETLPAV